MVAERRAKDTRSPQFYLSLSMKKIKKFWAKKRATIALYTVAILILINTFFSYQYKKSLNDNIDEHAALGAISKNKEAIISNLNNIDMSLRGFLLVGNDAFVDTYNKIKKESAPQMAYLQKNLPLIGVSPNVLDNMNRMQNGYFKLMDEVIELEKTGKHTEALEIIKQDHGTQVWMQYVELGKIIDPIIKEKGDVSDNRYKRLLSLNLFFQILLFIIGIPTLVTTSFRLIRNDKARVKLYQQVDESNRKLIFDSSAPVDIADEKVVIKEIITNLNKTSTFIKGIATGDYEVQWDGFQTSSANNQNSISGQLLHMRDEMKKKQEEMKRQQWVSSGLNQLHNLIRECQENFSMLTEKSTSFIIKYLGAQQGSLFILNDNDEADHHLELVSAYAFNRKKHIRKRVEIGQGLIGQTFLEGEAVFMVNVPDEYITITSGLGEANPKCISIYPIKHNDEVIALIEVASFKTLDTFALDFLSNACKNLGATIVSIRNNEKTKVLLQMSQQQAEQMRAQEEEMRQNLEELEATQEEMKRREKALLEAKK
jgi:CHASE3 domain sensor protein